MQGDLPTEAAFEDIPRDAGGHFTLALYGAVHRLLWALRRADAQGDALAQVAAEHPMLKGYLEALGRRLPPGLSWEEGARWWEGAVAAWEASIPGHLPLLALRQALGLTQAQVCALLLVGLVEEDPRFGDLFASLQGHPSHRRPRLGIVARAVADGAGASAGWGAIRPLVEAGLVEAADPGGIRSERSLAVPAPLWDALRGERPSRPLPGLSLTPAGEAPPLSALGLAPELLSLTSRLPAALLAGDVSAVVVRGCRGSDGERLIAALWGAMGLGALAVEPGAGEETLSRVGALAILSGAAPALSLDLAPGETCALPVWPGYAGPVGVVLGKEGGLSGRGLERAVTLSLGVPTPDRRRQLWEAAAGPGALEDPDAVAWDFRLPAGHIRRAAELAAAHARLEGREVIAREDVRRATRALGRERLDTLATHLPGGARWSHLVVPPATEARLEEVVRRCRHRERLGGALGPAFGGGGAGVRALFSGPSGTGKTLAARILAAELGMDLYRVDLAAVINKYIGETEKNLHRILSHAEELDVVLLLDEGDALLGSRTDVKSANDRYANLETNYLLQRLEGYEGIVLITTNAAERIDSAFKRRMDVVVTFLPPQAQERWHIWQVHLPEGHRVDDATLTRLAGRCALTGGQIRNAALHAALLAVDEGRPVGAEHVLGAVASEYKKAGASSPLREPAARSHGGMEAFMDAVGR